jgi:hypothetical protein
MVFYGSGLKSIELPDGLTTIEKSAFGMSKRLKTIIIPNSVTTIGDQAFSSSGLQKITIPKSVTHIGELLFFKCSDSLVVQGTRGSAIEKYAKNNSVKFQVVK